MEKTLSCLIKFDISISFQALKKTVVWVIRLAEEVGFQPHLVRRLNALEDEELLYKRLHGWVERKKSELNVDWHFAQVFNG